jgi:hypothetical protein
MKKIFLFAGFVLAIILVFALTQFRPDGQGLGRAPAPAAEIHGELIQPAALADSDVANQNPTNNPPKRKHPKPPSVQVRMVMSQLAPSGQADGNGLAISGGTLGTAADLAKTNLTSASSLPAIRATPAGYQEVNFSTLSGFDFALSKEIADGSANPALTAATAKAQIPQSVQSLDGKKTVIQGFLLPVKMDDGLAVEFLLMRNQSMCCYGVPPKVNEWITVQMNGKGVRPVMDQPIAVIGTLHVGPTQENGFLTGIYNLDGEKVIGP